MAPEHTPKAADSRFRPTVCFGEIVRDVVLIDVVRDHLEALAWKLIQAYLLPTDRVIWRDLPDDGPRPRIPGLRKHRIDAKGPKLAQMRRNKESVHNQNPGRNAYGLSVQAHSEHVDEEKLGAGT